MKQTIVRTFIAAFGLHCVAVVSLIVFVGDPNHYEELEELASRIESDPSQDRLRDLLNYPAGGAYSYYKMALVGASFARHPTVFQAVANDFRTNEEREGIQGLGLRGSEVFEYHPELKPAEFEQRFKEQDWLPKTRGDSAVSGNLR